MSIKQQQEVFISGNNAVNVVRVQQLKNKFCWRK